MKYYKSNALYDALQSCDPTHSQFVWAGGNSWILCYGSSSAEPLMLLLAMGRSARRPHGLFALTETIGLTCGQPYYAIEFDDESTEISDVVLLDFADGSANNVVSLDSLIKLFSKHLPITGYGAKKAVKSETSSAYHEWQRNVLGSELTVTDLDLFRVRDGIVNEICELKRSFYSVDDWRPFPADYDNFRLICRLIKGTEICFNIVYNRRTKNPWNDDPSRLSVFSFKEDPQEQIIRIAILSFADFVRGTYLRKAEDQIL